jgi:hypothetical protein
MKIPSQHPAVKETKHPVLIILTELRFDFNPKLAHNGQFMEVIVQSSPDTIVGEILDLSVVDSFKKDILER